MEHHITEFVTMAIPDVHFKRIRPSKPMLIVTEEFQRNETISVMPRDCYGDIVMRGR